MKIIENVDRCICCGCIVPEGRQVCFTCEEIANEKNEDMPMLSYYKSEKSFNLIKWIKSKFSK